MGRERGSGGGGMRGAAGVGVGREGGLVRETTDGVVAVEMSGFASQFLKCQPSVSDWSLLLQAYPA